MMIGLKQNNIYYKRSGQLNGGAMAGRRDLNVSGNKVINLKWPTKSNDAATMGYVDNAHLLKPSDNVHEYTRYINNRNDLLHSIAGLVRVKSNMEYHHKKNYQGEDMHFWVESPTSTLEYCLKDRQQLPGRFIEVFYHFPVCVNSWYFNIRRDKYEDWEITYHWQYSDNGVAWTYHGHPTISKTIKNDWCGNDTLLKLNNDHEIVFKKFWRIVFVEGFTNNNHVYINFMRMKVSAD